MFGRLFKKNRPSNAFARKQELYNMISSGRTTADDVRAGIAAIYVDTLRVEQETWIVSKQNYSIQIKNKAIDLLAAIKNNARIKGATNMECAAGFLLLSLELSLSNEPSAVIVEQIVDEIITQAIKKYVTTTEHEYDKLLGQTPAKSDEISELIATLSLDKLNEYRHKATRHADECAHSLAYDGHNDELHSAFMLSIEFLAQLAHGSSETPEYTLEDWRQSLAAHFLDKYQ